MVNPQVYSFLKDENKGERLFGKEITTVPTNETDLYWVVNPNNVVILISLRSLL